MRWKQSVAAALLAARGREVSPRAESFVVVVLHLRTGIRLWRLWLNRCARARAVPKAPAAALA